MYSAKNEPSEVFFRKLCGHVPRDSFEKNCDVHTGSFPRALDVVLKKSAYYNVLRRLGTCQRNLPETTVGTVHILACPNKSCF